MRFALKRLHVYENQAARIRATTIDEEPMPVTKQQALDYHFGTRS